MREAAALVSGCESFPREPFVRSHCAYYVRAMRTEKGAVLAVAPGRDRAAESLSYSTSRTRFGGGLDLERVYCALGRDYAKSPQNQMRVRRYVPVACTLSPISQMH